MNASYIKRLLQAPSSASFAPSSSLTHCTHLSLCRYHEKQEAEVLLPAAIAHSPHHSVILLYLFHPYIFADLTSTYSACTPANGFHWMSSNLVLPTTFHPGNRLPGFSIQISRNGIQFAKNTFCVLQDTSLLLSYQHVFIEILHSSY